MRGWSRLLGALVGIMLGCVNALAQGNFPSAPVHILVPCPPGGAVDIIARTIGDELGRQWGQARLTDLGAAPVGSSPAELSAFIKSEYEKWGPVIRAAGIKAE